MLYLNMPIIMLKKRELPGQKKNWIPKLILAHFCATRHEYEQNLGKKKRTVEAQTEVL